MTATKGYYEMKIQAIIEDENILDIKYKKFEVVKYNLRKDTELNTNDKNHLIRYINNELVIIQDIQKEWLDLIKKEELK